MPSFELPPPSPEVEAIVTEVMNSAIRPADSRYVRFYTRDKRDADKSRAEGRPVFAPVEYIEILTPGDKDTVVDRPVRPADPYIWTDKYKAFKEGSTQESGLPLGEWGGVPSHRVAELAHFKVRTVEQLADVPDVNLGQLGMNARAEREKARAYLAVMRDNAPVAEIKAENVALKARLDALEKLAAAGSLQPAAESKPKAK